MKTSPLLLTALLVLGACSSTPSTDRPGSPDRPEVPRPEGVEPAGLADMRDTLGAQRADARAMDNALNVNSTSATMPSDQTFLESVFSPVANTMQSIRQFIFGAPIAPQGANAQATK
jgi:hypothetical protein